MEPSSRAPYVPGEEISVDLGRFEHGQILTSVRVVYVDAGGDPFTIKLGGSVEDTREVRRGEDGPTFESRATASAVVGKGQAVGQYRFDRIEGYTYSERWIPFRTEEEDLRRRSVPSTLSVSGEQPNPPHLV